MIKIVNDELVELMGGTAADINLKGKPVVILIAPQGSGKTTFSGKLAYHLKKNERKKPPAGSSATYTAPLPSTSSPSSASR